MTSPSGAPPPSIAELRRSVEEGVALRGFRSACGFATATWALRCPQCGLADLAPVELATEGRIVAASVQHVPSDEFLNDAPYAYVIVELDGGPRLAGWIPTIADPALVLPGTRVRWSPSYKPGVQFAVVRGDLSAAP